MRPRTPSQSGSGLVGRCPGHADPAEEFREKTFLAGGVNEAAAGEGRGVQSAETASTDDEREDEGPDGAEDDGAKLHGYGGGGRDRVRGKHEDIGNVREEIGEDDEWHSRMNNTGEITVRRDKLADDIIGLVVLVAIASRGFL